MSVVTVGAACDDEGQECVIADWLMLATKAKGVKVTDQY